MRFKVVFVYFIASIIGAKAQVRLTEDFSLSYGSFPPPGWDNTLVNGVNTDKFTFDNPYGITLGSPSSDRFATFSGYFLSNDSKPEEAWLTSPSFNCAEDNKVTLLFYDYYFLDENVNGGIEVLASTDEQTWASIYKVNSGESEAIPKQRKLDISAYTAGKSSVKIRFRAWGSNSVAWIIDDISVVAGPSDPPIISHKPLASTCETSAIEVNAEINSPSGISNAVVAYKEGNGPMKTVSMEYNGNNKYKAVIQVTNSWESIQYHIKATDASINLNTAFDTGSPETFNRFWLGNIASKDFIENFDNSSNPAYFIQPNSDNLNWDLVDVITRTGSNGKALALNFFEERYAGHHASFQLAPVNIQPDYHILVFDIAYAFYEKNYDTLEIRASMDRGQSWNLVYKKYGKQISKAGSVLPPFTADKTNWYLDYVDLKEYSNKCTILSFEGISANGNNLYIDNLGFQKLENLNIIVSQNYPNPAKAITKIDLNIPMIESSQFLLFDLSGRLVQSVEIEPRIGTFTLNIDTSELANGIYIYQVTSANKLAVRRMIVLN